MSGPAPSGGRPGDRVPGLLASASPARRFIALCAVALAVYLARPLPDAVGAAALGVVGLGCSVAVFRGVALHRPAPAWPWRCLGLAACTSLLGALVRPWAAAQDGALIATADAFTMPGYGLLLAGLLGFLRARRGLDAHAFSAGVPMTVGGRAGLRRRLRHPGG